MNEKQSVLFAAINNIIVRAYIGESPTIQYAD